MTTNAPKITDRPNAGDPPEGRQRAIFVIGPESSGSTYVAKVINRAVGNPAWNGRGFNCCDDNTCDLASGHSRPHAPVEHLVCHRSLPFGQGHYPPIDQWIKMYDAWFVICTRDQNISEQSRKVRFHRKSDYAAETDKAISIIRDIVAERQDRVFIFSYESLILLNSTYLNFLYDFLGISEGYYPDDILDANSKHVRPSASMRWKWFWHGLVHRLRRSMPDHFRSRLRKLS